MSGIPAPSIIRVPGSAAVRPNTATDSLMIQEKAAAVASIAGFGQLWVKTATPNQLWFTNDAGTDVQLGVSGITIDSTAITGGAANGILFESATNKVTRSPNFVYDGTQLITPKIVGGTGTTSTLTYQTTTGVGATGARHIFLVGNNGAIEAMTILNNGNVGIGASSPGAKLHLFSNAATGPLVAKFEYTGADTAATAYTGLTFTGASGDIGYFLATTPSYSTIGSYVANQLSFSSMLSGGMAFIERSTGPIVFNTGGYTADKERMRISNTGLVGINKTAPGAQLHVVSGSATTVGTINEGAAAQSVDMAQWNPSGVTAGTRARVTSAGAFSNNLGINTTEVFGAGATATKPDSVVIGYNASSGGTDGRNVVIGSRASITNNRNSCVAIGKGVRAGGGDGSVAIGYATNALGSTSVAIGYSVSAGHADAIAIGRGSTTTAANQFISGGNAHAVSDVYFGKGVTNATPTAYTIHGTGGSGTDITGAALNLAGGQGTGTGAAGVLNLQTAPAGTTGSSLNSLVTAAQFDASTTATHTRMLLYDVDTATLQRVTVGAADSGGTGFKLLRIPN